MSTLFTISHLVDAFIQYRLISISNKANNINHRYGRYMIRMCIICRYMSIILIAVMDT